MFSIPQVVAKIKQEGWGMAEIWLKDWGMVGILALVALSAFGLGRLSALEEAKPLISVSEADPATEMRAMPLGGQFIASRTGTVYYYPWCSGAQQIAENTQIWFTSEKAAQKAGYVPAKNCKGLSEVRQ